MSNPQLLELVEAKLGEAKIPAGARFSVFAQWERDDGPGCFDSGEFGSAGEAAEWLKDPPVILRISPAQLKPIKDLDDAAIAGLLPDDLFEVADPIEQPDDEDPCDVKPVVCDYPLDMLGEAAELVQGFADAVFAPAPLAALPMLAVVSAALGPRWRVGPPGLVRPARLWFVVVAPPGTAKTPTARPILEPLYRADTREREVWELACEQRGERRKRGEGADPLPVRRRLIASDTTPEALEAAMADADGYGLLAHADELPRLLGGMSGYTPGRGGAGRAAWLSTWSGEPLRVLRRASASVEADNPHLAVYAGVQPDRLHGLGLLDGDGLLPRFLFAWAEASEHGLGPGVPERIRGRWARVVERAVSLPQNLPVQPFTPEACELLDEAMRHHSRRNVELFQAGMGALAGAHAKAADHAVRLAAALHGLDALLEDDLRPRDVPAGTLRRALALLDYHLAMHRQVIRLASSPPPNPGQAATTDDELAVALRQLLAPGESRTLPAKGWQQLLKAAPCVSVAARSPVTMGRALRRLAAEPRTWLSVTRVPRGAQRGWRVERVA